MTTLNAIVISLSLVLHQRDKLQREGSRYDGAEREQWNVFNIKFRPLAHITSILSIKKITSYAIFERNDCPVRADICGLFLTVHRYAQRINLLLNYFWISLQRDSNPQARLRKSFSGVLVITTNVTSTIKLILKKNIYFM